MTGPDLKDYKRPIPAFWFVVLLAAIVAVFAFSMWFTTGVGVVVNILLGVMATVALWLLWVTPSKAGRIEIEEMILGIALLVVGALIGSSPTWHPYIARGWTAVGLDPRLVKPLAAPSEDMWDYEGTRMVPKPTVPAGQQLVVQPSGSANGVLVTDEGLDLQGRRTAEIWLQDRGNGYTSSSVLIHIPPDVTDPSTSSGTGSAPTI